MFLDQIRGQDHHHGIGQLTDFFHQTMLSKGIDNSISCDTIKFFWQALDQLIDGHRGRGILKQDLKNLLPVAGRPKLNIPQNIIDVDLFDPQKPLHSFRSSK